jgi:chemotaxis protein MotB
MSGDGGHGGGHGRRRGHEEEHEEHENHERWLVSYADMMTLLMVLFIVMFAISQVDSKKFMALKTGLAAGFGAPLAMLNGADALLDVGGAVAPDAPNLAGVAGNKNADPEAAAASKAAQEAVNPQKVAELVNAMAQASVKGEVANLQKAQAELQKALQVAGLAKGATFRIDERGLVVSVATDKVLYASGSAALLPGGRRILDVIAPTLLKLPNHLGIDGHTDSNPIHTAQFTDNWDLSSARANAVLRYLHASHGIPFTRMTSAGHADTQPVAKGHDAASMAANRRVEIVVTAMLDNGAGRALAKLGNATGSGATSKATATATSTATSGSASDPTEATDGETSPTTPAAPTPKHNLLGPDPTTSTTRASPTR